MLTIVLLAGGKGRRMHSDLPKVLHPVGGKPILFHLIETALRLNPKKLLVVYGNPSITRACKAFQKVQWVHQTNPLGTGHALAQVLPYLEEDSQVLILPGDTPLIAWQILTNFIQGIALNAFGLMTAKVTNPTGLGRIIRDSNHEIIDIIEDKDTKPAQQCINEVNVSVYCISALALKRWVPKLSNQNAQQEYYLTDIIKYAIQEAVPVIGVLYTNSEEIQGINNQLERSQVEKTYQRLQNHQFLLDGLTLIDPDQFWVSGHLTFGGDVTISPYVTIKGKVTLGNRVSIGPYSVLEDVTLGDDVVIGSHCVLQSTTIESKSCVGPFAHLHRQVHLQSSSVVGNFVEVTRSQIGEGSKVKHLSYLGDVVMKEKVNIGAGTITCNYDGVSKHPTYIGKNVRIGANSSLIAPVTIEDKATIGAGSVITDRAPAGQLTLTRSPQVTVSHWKRPEDRTDDAIDDNARLS